MGFLIDDVPLAVEARLVKAVTWAHGIIRVPFARKLVAGVIVREGRIVPVLDLALAPAAWNRMPRPGGEQVLIVGEGETEAGLLARSAEAFHAGAPARSTGGSHARRIRESLLEGSVAAGGRTYAVINVPAALQAAGVPQTFSG